MRAAIALLGSLVFFVGNATAANWVHLTDTDSAQVFIDTDSIAKWDGKIKAWFLYEYGGPQTADHKKYLSSKDLAYFDCTERSMVLVQIVRYEKQSGTGDVVSTIFIPMAPAWFEDVVPETLGETMQMFACSVAGHGQ